MTTSKLRIHAALALAGTLVMALPGRAEKPAWCKNGTLLETRTFSDGAAARDYANANSTTSSATINGVTHQMIGIVDVVVVGAHNRTYVVQVWDCAQDPPPPPPPPPPAAGKEEKVTYTFDPHPELDRNGKRR